MWYKDRLKQRSLTILGMLDVFALAVSPLAIILFIFLMIAVADGLGQHVQMIRALDQYGVVGTGVWQGVSSDGKLGSIEVAEDAGEPIWLPVYTKYYSSGALAGLQEGQRVRVRFVYQYGQETRAVLEDYYPDVRGYLGYITDYFWPILVSWLIIVAHPDFLYLGLAKDLKPFAMPQG